MILIPMLCLGIVGWALPGSKKAITIAVGTDWLLGKVENWSLKQQLRVKVDKDELTTLIEITITREDTKFFTIGPNEDIRKAELVGKWILTRRERHDFFQRVQNDMLARRSGPTYTRMRKLIPDEETFVEMLRTLHVTNAGYFEDLRQRSKVRAKDPVIKALLETARAEKARKVA